MELIGLTLTQALMVFGGFGLAVLALYLLKLRRRRVHVPFIKLWETLLAEKQTTRLFSQLKRWLSFLLALLMVALLAAALGNPRVKRHGALSGGRALVVLIDASASMQATDVKPSRFAQAQKEVARLIDELGPADRMLIAQLDAVARPLSPLTDDARVLRDALKRLAVTDIHADLRAGLRLANDVLRDQPHAETVVISDGGLQRRELAATELDATELDATEQPAWSWIKVGTQADNVGISAFSVRRYPLDKTQSEVLVELFNPTSSDRTVELTLLGDGNAVDVQKVVVNAEERLRRFFRNISGVDQTLEANIQAIQDIQSEDYSKDYLAVDNHAFARLPERRRARVLLVMPKNNLYLQAALFLDEYLDVAETTPAQYASVIAAQSFDVIIFDRWVPPSAPPTNALYIHPDPDPNTQSPLEVRGEVSDPHFTRVDRRHPLMKWTAFDHVNMARALVFALQPGDTAVARDHKTPLIVEGTRQGHRFIALAFDVRESDLPLRIAWPLFLLNAIDWFVQEQAGYISSHDTGRTWHLPVPQGLTEAVIVTPDNTAHTVPVIESRAVYAGRQTGFYTLRTADGDDVFAVNLGDDRESRIAPEETLTAGTHQAGQVSHGEVGVRREVWLYLVFIVFAFMLVEWWTYHRRWTV